MGNRLLLASAALLAVIGVVLWSSNRPVEHSLRPFETESRHDQATPAQIVQLNGPSPDEYPQVSLKTMSQKEAVREYNENTKRDLRYEWKIPIRFYGKVIDQYSDPVMGASVDLQWVNLDGKEGVGEAKVATDGEGLFSLEGVKGKRLIVKIAKSGYYDLNSNENQTTFEFANPAERIFYEPDVNNPVRFLLRKKGQIQPLIVKSIELKLSGQGMTGTVDLLTGKASPSGGQLQVTVWKPTITTEQINTGKVFPYDWRVRARINNGGLVEHKNVFAFEAPESGYIAEYDANLHPTSGMSPDVTVSKHFYFFFGQPRKYGRMHFRTDGARPYVFIDYWLNPTPDNRNLEYDPSAR